MKRGALWRIDTRIVLTLLAYVAMCQRALAVAASCPASCHCTDTVTTCRNAQLSSVPHGVPPRTLSLVLDGNGIEVLRNASVCGALQSLSVQYNGLRRLEENALAGLPQLTQLHLAGNRLRALPLHLFRHNPLLRLLDLRDNALTALPDAALLAVPGLRRINLADNRLTELRLGPGWRTLTQLSLLDLSGNRFARLPADAFRAALHWDATVERTVNLSACGLRRLDRDALSPLPGLASLSLSGNIHVAQADLEGLLGAMNTTALRQLDLSRTNASDVYPFFRRAELRSLQVLGLAMNGIRALRTGTFFYLVQLRELDLSHNRLEELTNLGEMTHLRRLNLAYNYLSRLRPAAFEGLPHLTSLDLSHNALATLTEAPFVALWSLRELDVSCNRLEMVSVRGGLESLQRLHVHSNRIPQLDFIERLLRLQELDASNNVITRIPAATFTHAHALQVVNLSANAIYDISTGAFRGSALSTVDLSHNRLLWLADYGWRQVRRLYLQSNSISNVSATALRGLARLHTLHLSDNQLSSLPAGALEDLPSLQELHLGANPLGAFLQQHAGRALTTHPRSQLTWLSLAHTGLSSLSPSLLASHTSLTSLDLSGNSLQALSPSVFAGQTGGLWRLSLAGNRLTAPDPQVFASLRSLHILDLSDNPLHCSCQLLPFRDWLAASDLTPVTPQRAAYRCASPPEWRDVELTAFDLDATACRHHHRVMIIAAAASAVLFVIVIAVVVAVCRYRCIRRRKTKLDKTRYCAMTNTVSVRVNSYPPKQYI